MKNLNVASIAESIFNLVPDAALALEKDEVLSIYLPEDLYLDTPISLHVETSQITVYRSGKLLKKITEIKSESEAVKQVVPFIEALSKDLSASW